jgi:hypothetical protein
MRCASTLSRRSLAPWFRIPEQRRHPKRSEIPSDADANNTTKSLAAYLAELEKCVLLCATCHGEVEAGLLVGPPAGATYEDVLHIYGGPDRQDDQTQWAPGDSNPVSEIKSLDV